MVHFPTRVGARVVHGAMQVQECRVLRVRLYGCVGVEGGRTGARRHPGVQVEQLGVHAGDASLTGASDVYQSPGNAGVRVRADAGVGADAGAGADADVDVDVDVGADVGSGGDVDYGDVGVGAYGCGDAGGCAHADVGSLLSFVQVVEAVPSCPEEGESDDGPASVEAGARANGSESTD